MNSNRIFYVCWMLCLFTAGPSARAVTSTTTLPKNIDSPSFRYGVIDGIGERYTQDGKLRNLGDHRSIAFDQAALVKFNKRAQELIEVLNRFGNQRLGDKFDMGVLRVDTKPELKYFAPVYARGLTEKWTLGFGLPVITYTNKISLRQENSNIAFYRQQFGGLNPELDRALNTDLQQTANDTLAERGYRRIENRQESYLGDAQLVSLYRFYDDGRYAWAYQAEVNLPTGPQYDADDLIAVNIFGRTNVLNRVAFSARPNAWLTVVPYVSYLVNVPDQVTKRVPLNDDDTLPDAASKKTVARQIGNTASVGGNLFFDFNDEFSFATGYEYASKAADHYGGEGNRRYDLLSLETQARTQKVRGQFTYSTVKSYFKKASAVPMMVAVEVTDTVAGTNAERQLIQELSLMLFF